MVDHGTLSAQEAADALGITTATLYSYVSRGLIRSQEGIGKSRARRYDAGDVQALKERKAQRRSPERAAAAALAFGSPILESSITLIEDGGLYYRGQSTIDLARTRTFEEVAALLWTGAPSPDELFTVDQRALLPEGSLGNVVSEMSPLDAFQTLLLPTSHRDLAAYNTESSAVARTGVRLMRLLAWCITGTESVEPLAVQLQRTWTAENPHAVRLLDAALILCADHELNISAFTARCVASAGTSPYLAINAALCALRGYRHGGQTERVDEMFDEAAGDPATAVAEHLRRGQPMPGFGHPLYPQGDPRGKVLVDLVRATIPDAPILPLADALIDLCQESMNVTPTIDFGLALLARTLNLPKGTPLLLFAAGRTAGWIGQIIEEYQRGQLIRPRARYVGVRPEGFG